MGRKIVVRVSQDTANELQNKQNGGTFQQLSIRNLVKSPMGRKSPLRMSRSSVSRGDLKSGMESLKIGSLDGETSHSVRKSSSSEPKQKQKPTIKRTRSVCSAKDLQSMENMLGIGNSHEKTEVAKPKRNLKSSERSGGRGRSPKVDDKEKSRSLSRPRFLSRARSLSRVRPFSNTQDTIAASDDSTENLSDDEDFKLIVETRKSVADNGSRGRSRLVLDKEKRAGSRSLSRPRDFKSSKDILDAYEDIFADESQAPETKASACFRTFSSKCA
jgi:hypothetical protein